jgi:predicted O-methyltransferase YrrM/prolipoprotein diacylglyceryltransferase
MLGFHQFGISLFQIVLLFSLVVLAVIQVSVRDEFQRRKISGNSFLFSILAVLAGIVGSQLESIINAPSQFFITPLSGFLNLFTGNYYDGLLAGFVVVVLLARYFRSPLLAVLDALSPVGAFFAVFGGKFSFAPFWWLIVIVLQSRFFGRPSSKPRPDGLVFAIFLTLIGAVRILVGYLARNAFAPFNLTWPQATNLICIVIGIALFAIVKSRFHKLSKEHRILDDAQQRGLAEQPESKSPTPECPHPERWRMYDAMTAEVEVLEFLKTLVTTLKPNLVVETGTFMGVSTLWIAEGLKRNGFGRVITCEFDPKTHAAAKKRFDESGLAEWIDLRLGSSLDLKIDGTIDILFSDSDLDLREKEVRRFLPQINPNGVILMHDASSHLKTVREAALRLEQEGLISVLLLPTPRGLVIAQKRAGRK